MASRSVFRCVVRSRLGSNFQDGIHNQGRTIVVLPPSRTMTSVINLDIDKTNPIRKETVTIADIGEKKAFCRCWRSKKFPLCDGSHAKHNKETGDNVGPLIIVKNPQ